MTNDYLDMAAFERVTIPSSVLFFTGSGDDDVHLWDVNTQCKVAALKGHTEMLLSVAFDGSGTYLASGGA